MGSYDTDTSWDRDQGTRGSSQTRAVLLMGKVGRGGTGGRPPHTPLLGPRMSAAALSRGKTGFRDGGEEIGKKARNPRLSEVRS